MREPSFLTTADGRKLAYHHTEGRAPGVVFLGGFASDMEGTKALHLEDWARRTGRAFLRFDYSGHGQSSGRFVDGSIGEWFADARAAISSLTSGPQILVGSSMGGWISLLCARHMPDRIAGLVTVAAAPDFTEDGFWESFSEAQKSELMETGEVALANEYSEAPYIISRKLIEDGRANLLLREPLHLPFATRFLQGTADTEVSVDTALRLLNHATGDDLRLTLVKDADHRFSSPQCLDMITAAVEDAAASQE